MEVMSDSHDGQNTCESFATVEKKENEVCEISSNWKINNDRKFVDTISITPFQKATNRPTLEEIVSLDTCIELRNSKEPDYEPCVVDIKITNGQKISSIALVSEASVLEFYKQFGEYAATVFPEFVDEFQNNSVYMGVASFDPPTSEASIKFAKAKNKTSLMWLYGIRLTLTDPVDKEETKMFNPQKINEFLLSLNKSKSKSVEMANKVLQSLNGQETNQTNEDLDACLAKFIGMGLMTHKQRVIKNEKEKQKAGTKCPDRITDPAENSVLDMRTYIDSKFVEIEKNLMKRIDQMDQKTNQKLDAIMKMLEISLDSK